MTTDFLSPKAGSYPHVLELPPSPVKPPKEIDPRAVATEWLANFEHVLASGDASQLSSILHDDCWWRDAVTLTWDLRTFHTLEKINSLFSNEVNLKKIGFSNLKIREPTKLPPILADLGPLQWVESMYTFETAVGRGRGMIRLTQDVHGQWKGYLISTALFELKGHEEAAGHDRPHGGKNSLNEGKVKGNWFERRERQREFLDDDPTVLIVGAGQAGLMIGARLQAIGVPCLLIDRNQRIGDNWRKRYRTLVTHDPVQMCHLPYMPFPSTWPTFTPKDKIADFFEAYASLLELNVWLQTSIVESKWSDEAMSWTITLSRKDKSEKRTFRPKHVVFCTGHSGEPKIPTFPGQDQFKGTLYHGSQHQDASTHGNSQGKKVVVVGTGNSGHDIAQNYYEAGADVTIIQRSPTYVITGDKGLPMLTQTMYGEGGPETEDADVHEQSVPLPIYFRMLRDATDQITAADKDLLIGLQKAGFAVDSGIGGAGILSNYYRQGGGYYIDVGCSELIAAGKIRAMRSENGISGFDEKHLILADGRKLDADVVVLATGYENMRTSLRKTLGDEIADQCKDVWGMDEEGEFNAMWRPSGHPGVWYMGGNLLLCRSNSRSLALQIKGIELGLNPRRTSNKGKDGE
ncbi:putative flavin-containing monooxygenase YUCCA3 [Patellaria atrata CBS 101060]|uniref:Flavin-containing monooxygenase YUCCA3 n=1 Tax=Patellaria atrata CBS 101060 TaxID=1346257 RepID=A0A9P4SBN4_9PEZI|nr:putative flavin-containing monooxygenase YUCCA3 [Patellaria atrata CBS 101060]